VFLLFYILLDLLKLSRAAAFLVPAGRNPLAAYLLPDQIGNILVLAGGLLHVDLWRAVWPFAEKGGWPGMLNAAVLTALVLFLTTLLTRAKVVLKL
jgi:heparan-alpha-glucosaminide N-acetyltransferase